MHHTTENTPQLFALIFCINLLTLGVVQGIVGIMSLIFVTFNLLKQIKSEGGIKKYVINYIELINPFSNNDQNVENPD